MKHRLEKSPPRFPPGTHVSFCPNAAARWMYQQQGDPDAGDRGVVTDESFPPGVGLVYVRWSTGVVGVFARDLCRANSTSGLGRLGMSPGTSKFLWIAGGLAVITGGLWLMARSARAAAGGATAPGQRFYVMAQAPDGSWVIGAPSSDTYEDAQRVAQNLRNAMAELGLPDAQLRIEGTVADTLVWLVVATSKEKPELGPLTIVAHVDRSVAERVSGDLAEAMPAFDVGIVQDWIPRLYLTGTVAQAGQSLPTGDEAPEFTG